MTDARSYCAQVLEPGTHGASGTHLALAEVGLSQVSPGGITPAEHCLTAACYACPFHAVCAQRLGLWQETLPGTWLSVSGRTKPVISSRPGRVPFSSADLGLRPASPAN